MHIISAFILAGGGLVASISGSALAQAFPIKQIGRASCRERV